MTIYEGDRGEKMLQDIADARDEQQKKEDEAMKILRSDELPPFLAAREAAKILGSLEKAKALQRIALLKK